MARAVVTGSGPRVDAVASGLAEQGIEVATAAGAAGLPPDLGPVDHYVQLPAEVTPTGSTVVGRVRSYLADGLLGRYALVERLLPVLADGATVVLVAGSMPGSGLPDDHTSRVALLHVLAHATRAEAGPRGVRVTVAGGDRDDAEIVGYALRGGEDPTTRPAFDDGDGVVSDRRYQDWRTEVMGVQQA